MGAGWYGVETRKRMSDEIVGSPLTVKRDKELFTFHPHLTLSTSSTPHSVTSCQSRRRWGRAGAMDQGCERSWCTCRYHHATSRPAPDILTTLHPVLIVSASAAAAHPRSLHQQGKQPES